MADFRNASIRGTDPVVPAGTLTHDAGNWSANSLQFGNSVSTLDIGGGILSLTSGAVLTRTTTGGTLSIQIANGQLGATDSELIFHSYSLASSLISATISGGTGRFTLDGGARVVLTGNSTYTGNTVVSGNTTLQIGNSGSSGSISDSASVIVTTGSMLSYNRTDAGSVKQLTGGGVLSVNSGTLTLNQSGTANLASITGTTGATVEFAGNGSGVTTVGDPLLGNFTSMLIAGQNYKFTNGTVNFVDAGRGAVSNIEIAGGIVNSSASQFSMTGIAGGTQTFTMSGGQFNQLGAFGLKGFNGNGGAGGAGLANSTFIGNQSGGTISITGISGNNRGGLEFGSTSATNSTTYNFSGGLISITTAGGLFNLGADTAGTSSTTFNFNGGKLSVYGTIQGNQGAGAKQAFVWTGGTLVAGTYTATNLTSAAGQAVVTGTTNILTNAGGILAPGDIGTGGRTTITGSYNITSANAVYAVDIGSATPATAFQSGAAFYDQTTVSGATTLNGRLNFSLINGYAPPDNTTTMFRIIAGSANGLTGAFVNQVTATSGNSRVVGADGLSSFLIAINNTDAGANIGGLTNAPQRSVSLGGYKATNTYIGTGTAWDTAAAGAWANFDAGATATPATQASGAIAQFADGTASTGAIGVSLNSTRNIQGIQFASAAGSRAYTISNGGSGAIILDNTSNAAAATVADTSTSGTANAINVPITLASNLDVSVTNAANTLAIGGAITGTGKTLTKTGAGTLALSGTNTYTGATTVTAGTLLINGNGAGATGAVSLSNSGTVLGGSGTIGGATTIGANATLAPGNSPGLLTFDSSLTFTDLAKANFEIATGERGTAYDAVNVAGLLTYNGDLTLTINAALANTTYDLFGGASAGALNQTGYFDSLSFAGGGYSGTWVDAGSGVWTVSSNGQDFSFSQLTGDLNVVPEPATWALLAFSLTTVIILRRRRNS